MDEQLSRCSEEPEPPTLVDAPSLPSQLAEPEQETTTDASSALRPGKKGIVKYGRCAASAVSR